MIPTPTTERATETERQLAQAVDDARTTYQANRQTYQQAADRWREAVKRRQRLWRYTYTPGQAEDRADAEQAERVAYDALHEAAQDTDAAEQLLQTAIDAHEAHTLPPDDRTRANPHRPSYRTRATILTAHA